MPVTLEIIEDKQAFLLTMADPWYISDLVAVYPDAIKYLDRAAGRVHTIVDVSKVGRIPPRSLEGRHNPFIEHRHHGDVVVVGAQDFARRIIEAALVIARFRGIQFAEDVPAALKLLRLS